MRVLDKVKNSKGFQAGRSVASSQSGAISPKGLLMAIMVVTIGFIFLGYVMPIGLDAFFNANTSNWTSSVTNIWDILPIFGVLVILGVLVGFVIKVMT